MKYRQDRHTGKLIPIDDSPSRQSAAVREDYSPFVSPIDGTVVDGQKQYREHCRKHNVVPAAEFTPEFYARKAEERARLFTGQHTPQETLARKQEIYERWIAEERKHGR